VGTFGLVPGLAALRKYPPPMVAPSLFPEVDELARVPFRSDRAGLMVGAIVR
jgi:hypothetical protein